LLYIDEGISFGGSLVVVSHLIRYLDPAAYRAVVVSETNEELLNQLYPNAASRHVIKRSFNYTDWDRVRPRIRKLPTALLRSLVSLLMTIYAGLLNLPYYLKLWRLVRREEIDLIHHANGASHLVLTLMGCPYMATMQGIKTSAFSASQRWALRRMPKFLMISEAAHRAYVEHGGSSEIAETLPNPCDPRPVDVTQHDEIRRRYGISNDEKVFACFGRVVHWKGQREFAQAAVRVLEAMPRTRALIVGNAADGGEDYMNEVRAIVDASPHRDRVTFTGYVAAVDELYSVIDLAVHTSVVAEPFGLVVIEPMGFGIPIIAANAGGPTEIVADGVDGYLVDPRDTDALSERIERLLRDDELRARFGAAGFKKVEAQYHARRYTARMTDIYDEILGARA
jgi:glycosyltransferase involved in cell wall biosynthesis